MRQVLQVLNGRGFAFEFQDGMLLTGKGRNELGRQVGPHVPDQTVGEFTGTDSMDIFS